MSTFSYERSIHFSDTDAAGVVYFPRLLSLCHEAYETSLMAAGIDLPQFFQGGVLATPITHVEADFRRPLQIGDRPVVHLNAELEEIATFRITYQIQLEGTVVATALTRHVCINPSTRARVSLPPELLSWLKSVQQEQILRTAMP